MRNTMLNYIIYAIIGLFISGLSVILSPIHTAYFMVGGILGWQIYKTYIKIKNASGSLYALKIRQLVVAFFNVLTALGGFLLGIGILYWIKAI